VSKKNYPKHQRAPRAANLSLSSMKGTSGGGRRGFKEQTYIPKAPVFLIRKKSSGALTESGGKSRLGGAQGKIEKFEREGSLIISVSRRRFFV